MARRRLRRILPGPKEGIDLREEPEDRSRELATYTFAVRFWTQGTPADPGVQQELDVQLLAFLRDGRERLQRQIESDVRSRFGAVEVKVDVRGGSVVIEVVLALMAAATAYKNFVELIQFYRHHLQELIDRFLWAFDAPRDTSPRVDSSSVIPGPATLSAMSAASASDLMRPYRYLLGFSSAVLVAALVAFLFWLFVTH